MNSPANISIGPADLALDAPISLLAAESRWHRRAFVGRMSARDVDELVRARRASLPEVMTLGIFGEPTWPAMVVSVEALAVAAPGVWSVRVELERRAPPERPMVGT